MNAIAVIDFEDVELRQNPSESEKGIQKGKPPHPEAVTTGLKRSLAAVEIVETNLNSIG